jgi:predicted ribosomally synthesized peptide with SipW-like signal peptide
MDKKILVSVMVIGLVAALAGAGLYAYFNDTETSSNNTFTAGTLDLTVNGPGFSAPITLSNMKPGDDTGYYKWVLKNAGTLPGKISVTFSVIINNENGMNEPEEIAEAQPCGWYGARPTLGDPTNGELGEYLRVGVERSAVEGIPGVEIIEYNDTEGWFIARVTEDMDIGGTIGWAEKQCSNPSQLYSQGHTGPPAYGHPLNVYGLNSLGGKTFGTLGYLPGDILGPGKEVAFFFRVNLQSDLRAWDGCGWRDINDNVIQGDSVTFSITFKLEQVP